MAVVWMSLKYSTLCIFLQLLTWSNVCARACKCLFKNFALELSELCRLVLLGTFFETGSMTTLEHHPASPTLSECFAFMAMFGSCFNAVYSNSSNYENGPNKPKYCQRKWVLKGLLGSVRRRKDSSDIMTQWTIGYVLSLYIKYVLYNDWI